MAAISVGTEGDIRPMVALGARLRSSGHDFLLAGDAAGQPLAEAHEITWLGLPGSLRERMLGDDAVAQHVRDGAGQLAGVRVLRQLYDDHLGAWTSDFVEAAHGADVILSSGLSLPVGFIAADRLHVPAVATWFQPVEPGLDCGSAMLPTRLPAHAQLPVFRAGQALGWAAVWRDIDQARHPLGLARRWIPWRGFPELGAWSPTLASRGGRRVQVTGQWETPAPAGFEPPADLVDFLADGPPPVLVGFGSMATPAGMLEKIIDGLDGQRVVLQRGWASSIPRNLPETVKVVGHVPHAWLLPRASCVVHHCGAGTSHAAVRAGVPSIPVPITVDQPFWARRLHRLGLGSRPLEARALRPDQMRRAVTSVERMRPTVQTASRQMAREDGAASAVAMLRRLVG